MMSTFEVLAGLLIIAIATIVAIPVVETVVRDGINMFKEIREMSDDE